MNQFDWDNLRVFLGVARARSALEASHTLGVDQSTISRRMKRLEADIGSKLFDRTSQGHRLTSAGHRLLEHVEKLESTLTAVESDVFGDNMALTGEIRLGATEMVKANGGNVVGSVRHPLNASDFSSFIMQAQASKAQVIGMANATQDAVNTIKASREFGIVDKGQKLAALMLQVTDVHAMGLQVAQGLVSSEGFYWDLDDQTRSFSSRFEKVHKVKPNQVHAGVYSSVLHYLKSVAAAKSDAAPAVAAKMRELPIKDDVMRNASIRPDGRVVHDMLLVEVKKPAQSKAAWDYYNILGTIPANTALRQC